MKVKIDLERDNNLTPFGIMDNGLDGIVSDDEIRAFKEKFKVPKSEIPKVAKIFNEAKKDTYGYKQIANQVGDLFSANKILLEELLNNLFYIAASDGTINKMPIKINWKSS